MKSVQIFKVRENDSLRLYWKLLMNLMILNAANDHFYFAVIKSRKHRKFFVNKAPSK